MSERQVIGYVRDAQTEETLPGAHVWATVNDAVVGTVTDVNGAFVLAPVPIGTDINVSFVGYRTLTFTNDGSAIDVMLAPGVGLDEFEVVGTRSTGKGLGLLIFGAALALLAMAAEQDKQRTREGL